MSWSLILAWLVKHWKTAAAAVVIGAIVVGFATLYSLLQVERGQTARLRGELDAKTALVETYKTRLGEVVAVNHEWQVKATEWTSAVDLLKASADGYLERLNAERAARRATETALSEAQAKLDAQITAPDCSGAVNQLIDALGWGTP